MSVRFTRAQGYPRPKRQYTPRSRLATTERQAASAGVSPAHTPRQDPLPAHTPLHTPRYDLSPARPTTASAHGTPVLEQAATQPPAPVIRRRDDVSAGPQMASLLQAHIQTTPDLRDESPSLPLRVAPVAPFSPSHGEPGIAAAPPSDISSDAGGRGRGRGRGSGRGRGRGRGRGLGLGGGAHDQ
jgi:hypothetical protein